MFPEEGDLREEEEGQTSLGKKKGRGGKLKTVKKRSCSPIIWLRFTFCRMQSIVIAAICFWEQIKN